MSITHPMAHADAAWLRMDRPTNLMIINSVLWFDEPVDWDRCRQVFRKRVVERFDPGVLAGAFRAELLALGRQLYSASSSRR